MSYRVGKCSRLLNNAKLFPKLLYQYTLAAALYDILWFIASASHSILKPFNFANQLQMLFFFGLCLINHELSISSCVYSL